MSRALPDFDEFFEDTYSISQSLRHATIRKLVGNYHAERLIDLTETIYRSNLYCLDAIIGMLGNGISPDEIAEELLNTLRDYHP